MLNQFSRTRLIFGIEAMEKLSQARVAVFGIGGVGSYTAEALVRSGIGAIDLIDDDRICLTNLNRQLFATRDTVGQHKVDVAEKRISSINPDCKVITHKTFYMPDTKDLFDFTEYDYIVDAIDTVKGMKNNLKSICRLIENGQYDEAKRLCVDSSESIAKVYTPINTDNPTLNAILNVEIEKARQSDISFSYTVTDSLDFVSSTDVVSIIGNLCENAIEYLSTIDKGQRKMSLEITVRNDYRIIVCRNTILSSVLSVNPDMKTTKNNDTLHGKGLNILRNIAEAYNGTLSYKEDDDRIEVTLIIKEEE